MSISLHALSCSRVAPSCSPLLPRCSLGAPFKAAMLPFLIESGNRRTQVRGIYNIYIYIKQIDPSINLVSIQSIPFHSILNLPVHLQDLTHRSISFTPLHSSQVESSRVDQFISILRRKQICSCLIRIVEYASLRFASLNLPPFSRFSSPP